MSREVDQRVVEMEFDNQQFERGVQTSLSTIDKLKNALKFENSSKGLENLGRAAGNVNVSGLGTAVEAVRDRFSVLETVATGALLKIGSIAVDTVGKLANVATSMNELNPENIAAGWKKFEDKTTSVATLVSQGYALEEVNAQLDRLNWFTDETSYNFTDMISNIAKFTASGQDLNTSVTAMEGIANWAALSGQNAATASRAMYQLSQAMGKGALRYDDFKSIQNANMDTKEFREQALATAEAMNIVKKNADETYTVLASGKKYSFAEMFSSDALTREQWLNGDAMMSVFNKYSSAVDQIYEYAEEHGVTASQAIEELGDQIDEFGLKAFRSAQEAKTWGDVVDATKDAVSTGWMKTFEYIIGDYNEAKTLYTQMANDFYDIFAGGSESRNELLGDVMQSGWKKFLGKGISDANDFKAELISVAKDSGVAIDDIIDNAGSFEESLHSGWLTADILKQSVANLTSRLSGLSDEELANSGYTKEQIETLEDLNHKLQTGYISAELYAEGMAKMSGRDNLVQALWNLRDALFLVDEETGQAIGIIAVFKEALSDVFPPILASGLYEITERIRDFTANLIMNEETAAKVKSVFRGVLSIFDIIGQAISAVMRSLAPLVDILFAGAGSALDFSAGIGDTIYNFAQAAKEGDLFYNKIQGAIEALEAIKDRIAEFGHSAAEVFTQLTGMSPKQIFETVKDAIEKAITKFKEFLGLASDSVDTSALDNVHTIFDGVCSAIKKTVDIGKKAISAVKEGINFEVISSGLEKLWSILVAVGQGIKMVLGSVWEGIKQVVGDVFSGLNNADVSALTQLTSGGVLAAIGLSLKKFVDGLSDITGSVSDATGLLSGFKDALFGKDGIFAAFQNQVEAGTILKIAGAVALLAGSIFLLSTIDSAKMVAATTAIGVIMKELVNAMTTINSAIAGGGDLKNTTSAMIKMSVALLIMSVAIKKIGELEWEQIIKGLAGIGGSILILLGVCKSMSKMESIAGKGVSSMIAMSVAVSIMALALGKIGAMSWEEIGKGVLGIGAILAEMIAVNRLMKSQNLDGSFGGTMIAVAASMIIFAAAMNSIGKLRWEELSKSVIGIGAILLTFAMAMKYLDGVNTEGAAASMFLIGASMLVFAKVLSHFGSMKFGEIGNGLVAMGGAIAEIVFALQELDGIDSLQSAVSLVVICGALILLAKACQTFASMSGKDVAKSLVALGVALAEISIAMVLMEDTVGGAASLLVASISLTVLAEALALFGKMSLGSIAKSLVALGVALAIVLVGATVAEYVAGGLLILNAAFLAIGGSAVLFGAGLALAGAAALLFSTALATIAAVGPGAAAAITLIVVTILNLVPEIITIIGAAITALAEAIIIAAPAVATAITAVIAYLLPALNELIPAVIEVAGNLITALLGALLTYIPMIVSTGLQLIAALLQGIADNIGGIVVAAVMIIVNFLGAIGQMLPVIINAGFELIVSFINGMADGIRNNSEEIFAAVRNLLSALIELVITALENIVMAIPGVGDMLAEEIGKAKTAVQDTLAPESFERTGKEASKSIVDGFSGTTGSFAKASEELIDSGTSSLDAAIPEFADKGELFGTSTVDGMLKSVPSMSDAGEENASTYISSFLSMQGDAESAGIDLVEAPFANTDIKAIAADAGEENASAYISSFLSMQGDAEDAGIDLGDSSADGIISLEKAFSDAGSSNASGFIASMTGKSSDAKNAGSNIASSGADGAGSHYYDFKQAGADSASGFAIGIRNNQYLASNAGSALGNAALRAAKAAVDSNSPAKKFIKLGHDSDEGFAIGLNEYAGRVFDSAYSVGEGSIDAMQDAVSKIGGILDGTLEMDPTIRPVIDLTNIHSGVDAINGMMSQQCSAGGVALKSITMSKPLEATGEISAMTARIQNGKLDSSRELIKALDKLDRPASGDTYNINGITYDDGSNISTAVRTLVRAARRERRV